MRRHTGDWITEPQRLTATQPRLAWFLRRKRLRKVEIHVTSFSDGAHDVQYACERKTVVVTSYGVSGSPESSQLPIEEIALGFREKKVTCTENNTTATS